MDKVDDKIEENELTTRLLQDKYNIKFYFLCQMFETCIQGRTKSKAK